MKWKRCEERICVCIVQVSAQVQECSEFKIMVKMDIHKWINIYGIKSAAAPWLPALFRDRFHLFYKKMTFWHILPWVSAICVLSYVRSISIRDRRGNNDISLDFDKLEQLGHTDSLIRALKDIAQSSHDCGVREVPKLRRKFLTNDSITCNDGSPAGWVNTVFILIIGQISLSKLCRPRSDAAERGDWSGSTLFATHPAFLISSIGSKIGLFAF